ncbi:pilus assembly PilX family protein [Candidatus Nitrospira bockiana]
MGRSEAGVALVTVMLIMVIMAVIGIAALSVTGLENRMAGFQRTGEAAATAAESCIGTAANVIQQTIDQARVPDTFRVSQGGPVPDAAQLQTEQEIMGQSDNNADTAGDPNPNLSMAIGSFQVTGDIDRLYAQARSGGALEFASGYDAGPGGGGVDIIYRIDCSANAGTTTSRVTAVYACAATGESCQRKI